MFGIYLLLINVFLGTKCSNFLMVNLLLAQYSQSILGFGAKSLNILCVIERVIPLKFVMFTIIF